MPINFLVCGVQTNFLFTNLFDISVCRWVFRSRWHLPIHTMATKPEDCPTNGVLHRYDYT